MYIHVYTTFTTTWTTSVDAVLLLSSMLWTQIALEKDDPPQTILLNAVRIWWNYNNGVLRIPTIYINVYT